MQVSTHRQALVKPTKKQIILEILYGIIYDMVKGTIGEKRGKRFVPLIFSLFVFILLCNLFGKDMQKGLIPNDIDFLGGIIQDICYRNAKSYFNF